MGSAAEAKIGAVYINGKEAVLICTFLLELGHPQPTTPIQVNNSTADGFTNDAIKKKLSKAIDMRFYWIRNLTSQGQFLIYRKPGITNLENYHTNHHSPAHHQLMRPTYLHTTEHLAQCSIAHILRRVCKFPCSHNCETRTFFSQNTTKTSVKSQTSFCHPTQKLLTRVPEVCPSTDVETIDSSTSSLSFDRRRNDWLTSQPSVHRPLLLLMTHVPDVCPPTITETKCCNLSAPSKTRIAIMSSLSY